MTSIAQTIAKIRANMVFQKHSAARLLERSLRGFWRKVEENDEIDFACNGNDICSTMADRLQGGRGDA